MPTLSAPAAQDLSWFNVIYRYTVNTSRQRWSGAAFVHWYYLPPPVFQPSLPDHGTSVPPPPQHTLLLEQHFQVQEKRKIISALRRRRSSLNPMPPHLPPRTRETYYTRPSVLGNVEALESRVKLTGPETIKTPPLSQTQGTPPRRAACLR